MAKTFIKQTPAAGSPPIPRFILARVKGNLSAPPKALAYHIREVRKGSIKTMAIAWDGVVEQDADDLLHTEQHGAKPRRLDDAKGWLRGILADGPLRATAVKAEADRKGISRKTLGRAKREVNVRSVAKRKKGSEKIRWFWALPDEATTKGSGE